MAYVNIGEENEQVEFKKSTGELNEGVISIASILNKHDRGDLYFGVKNNGDVIGQEISDTTTRDVSQAIRTNIKSPIYPTIEKLQYGDRDVVHVKFEGKRRPYVAYGIPRIRIADEDTQMDQELYREMLNARENRTDSWETKPSKYHISDIDKEVFDGYLRKARQVGRISLDSDDPQYVMTKLELADGDTLLNAGAALFVNCGINELQMARFASDERLTFNDIKRYTGFILDLADKTIVYVADAMDWRVEFDGSLERKEFPEIPVDAVREAVINAFGHRIIESGQSVEVAIYKSFIEIYSPGKSRMM
ncbi:MAG: putative DNA binding domain-containing protein [Butyrivibrio sp.]|nr:putative DNA binding domain-containing protein [Butyrivibrio sp.]